jgi:hypothetical protein
MRGAERYDIEEIIDPRHTLFDTVRIRRARSAAAHARAQPSAFVPDSAPPVGKGRQQWSESGNYSTDGILPSG